MTPSVSRTATTGPSVRLNECQVKRHRINVIANNPPAPALWATSRSNFCISRVFPYRYIHTHYTFSERRSVTKFAVFFPRLAKRGESRNAASRRLAACSRGRGERSEEGRVGE